MYSLVNQLQLSSPPQYSTSNQLNINSLLSLYGMQSSNQQKPLIVQPQSSLINNNLLNHSLSQTAALFQLQNLACKLQLLNNTTASLQLTTQDYQPSFNPLPKLSVNSIPKQPTTQVKYETSSQNKVISQEKIVKPAKIANKGFTKPKTTKKTTPTNTAPSSDNETSPSNSSTSKDATPTKKLIDTESVGSDLMMNNFQDLDPEIKKILEEPEKIDIEFREDEPALAVFTRNFPDWDLGEILDLFLLYTPEAIVESKKWHKISKEKRALEEVKKKQEEEAELNSDLKPKIRTRHWKNNNNNRKQEYEVPHVKKNYAKRTFMLRLRQLTELEVIDEKKAHAILATNGMDLKRALVTVQDNLEYYKTHLVL